MIASSLKRLNPPNALYLLTDVIRSPRGFGIQNDSRRLAR